MSNIVKEDAREARVYPARRRSDHPHSFQPTDVYRTCLHCGLPKDHEVHADEKLGDTGDVAR